MPTKHELEMKLAEKNIEIKKKNLEITALQKKVRAGNRAESVLSEWVDANVRLSRQLAEAQAERDAYAETSAAHREDWEQACRERDEARGSRDYWIDRYEDEGVRAEKAEAERDALQASIVELASADEDQRVEEQAKALYVACGYSAEDWDFEVSDITESCRAAIRAGWTPPESEATE